MAGVKGVKLARHDLLPAWPLTKLAEVYGHGTMKYADRNWEMGYEWGKSYAAAMRHLLAWSAGEDNDPESGLPHLAHAAWHMFALMEFQRNGIGEDTRSRLTADLTSELLNAEEIQNAKAASRIVAPPKPSDAGKEFPTQEYSVRVKGNDNTTADELVLQRVGVLPRT